MKTALVIGVLFGLIPVAAGCGGSPKDSKETAVATALEAVKTRDAQKFLSVISTPDDAETLCPARADELMEAERADEGRMRLGLEAEILKRTRACDAVDWSAAKEIGRRGGEFRAAMDGCGGKAGKYRDIRVTYALANGGEAEIKLDDPIGVEGGYFAFTDKPRCHVRGDQLLRLEKELDALAEKACACENVACLRPVAERAMALIKGSSGEDRPEGALELFERYASRVTPCTERFKSEK